MLLPCGCSSYLSAASDVFLKGLYMEVGIHSYGSFGTAYVHDSSCVSGLSNCFVIFSQLVTLCQLRELGRGCAPVTRRSLLFIPI